MEIRVITQSGSGEAPLAGLQTATFLLYAHIEGRERKKKRESKLSSVSCEKSTNPIY